MARRSKKPSRKQRDKSAAPSPRYFSPRLRRRLAKANDVASSNRFSRVPSRPPLLLTPRLEATCGTKFRGSSRRSPAVRLFVFGRKFPWRRESQAPSPRFQRFATFSNDDAYNENRPVRRSGRRRDESDAPGAERGRKVEPKAVRNKGISRIETTKRRSERPPSVDAKQSASRDNRGDACDGRKRQPNSTDRKQSRRRRSTRTAEPRVERRSNRKSRSRSPPPVPTRVSTIKYLAAKPTLRRRKFYATPPFFPKRALSLFVRLRFFSPNHPIFLPKPPNRPRAYNFAATQPPHFPYFNLSPVLWRGGKSFRENLVAPLFEKLTARIMYKIVLDSPTKRFRALGFPNLAARRDDSSEVNGRLSRPNALNFNVAQLDCSSKFTQISKKRKGFCRTIKTSGVDRLRFTAR